MSEEMNDASPPVVNAKTAAGNEGSSTRHAEDRHFFGMKARCIYPQQDVSDDYEQRFPEDPMFEETGPTARVWRTYLVESMAFDENMVGEARDGLDAMLVFAGLFSAVVTSFLVQTTENLQVDYTHMSASLLSELIAVQRASASGASINAVPSSSLNLNTKFVPDTLDVWVNGLWVVSLTLSLVVALSAVLIKQWLHRYIALRSGTPKDRSHIRHSRFIGFEKWQVLGIIGSLPVIMHLSLGLFLLGLVLFLIPLQLVLCCVIGSMTFIVYTLHLLSNILPLFRPHCPYQTPLSDSLVILLKQVSAFLGFVLPKTVAAADVDGSLSVHALHWLFNVSTNPSVHSVVLQALGGLPATAADKASELFCREDIYLVHDSLLSRCIGRKDGREVLKPGREAVAERLLRTYVISNLRTVGGGHSLMLIQHTSLEGLDPTSLTSFLSSIPDEHGIRLLPSSSMPRQLILSHHDVPHHPLVWKSLVRIAMFDGAFSGYQTDPTMFRILYSAVFQDGTHESTEDLLTMTQAVAVYKDLQQELCKHLLLELSVNNDAQRISLSVPARDMAEELVMRTVGLALPFVFAEPSNFDSAHWQIIEEVLSNWYSLSLPPMFFKEITTLLIEHTDICLSHPQGSDTFLEHRNVVLSAYYWRTWDDEDQKLQLMHSYAHFFYSEEQSTDKRLAPITNVESAVLRRAIEGTLFDLAFIAGSHRRKLFVVFNILNKGLQSGVPSAYELLVEYDCLKLVCEYLQPFKNWDHKTLLPALFITGLASNTVDEATKAICIDYLFQPQNLRLAALAFIRLMVDLSSWPRPELDSKHHDAVQERVNEFVRLYPHESTWDDCRQWLHRVSKWVAGGRKVRDLRIDEELGEDWMLRSVLESPGECIRYQEAIRWFIHSLNEFFAKRETVAETVLAVGHPHTTTMLNPTAIFVNPTDKSEQARESRWAMHRIPRLRIFQGREREREREPSGVKFEIV